ncbi:hypothetical protein [Streptomyces sp. FIT100]|uniref:hypothetical protein n=1 Tax=Streptomyces sp. FIT100 TaxID=2837956 RepID=UPI0021C5C392|nr:hypothetical protein [Streptomyces sp. FIT100]UUN27649.1 hypothetical protein KK483_15505 [Streptomyces sp. FIT100]
MTGLDASVVDRAGQGRTHGSGRCSSGAPSGELDGKYARAGVTAPGRWRLLAAGTGPAGGGPVRPG